MIGVVSLVHTMNLWVNGVSSMLYDRFRHLTAPIDDPDACQTLLWMLVSGMWDKHVLTNW